MEIVGLYHATGSGSTEMTPVKARKPSSSGGVCLMAQWYPAFGVDFWVGFLGSPPNQPIQERGRRGGICFQLLRSEHVMRNPAKRWLCLKHGLVAK